MLKTYNALSVDMREIVVRKYVWNKWNLIYYRNTIGMSKYNPAYSDSVESTKDPMQPDEKYYTEVVNTKVCFCFVFYILI